MEKYKTISKLEVIELLKNNSATLLDVRTDEEYQEKHLENSIHIPLNELPERLNELDKEKSYVTFCRSGVRSKSGALILQDNGFKKVYNSQEGILTWSK
ncbi:rhodanese-like domain-containing protein [uncultured Cetobacterium sp.]|uniref:rhodanese-like domain-containing protein n=1 Tax=uncultured Cetobacterium sp. TaxID=527638 RepID=UPI00262C8763|nr:rhodanese-like domain-containing protein [uncultured Cetobacterium sp.]